MCIVAGCSGIRRFTKSDEGGMKKGFSEDGYSVDVGIGRERTSGIFLRKET